jgi:plasmid stability protein
MSKMIQIRNVPDALHRTLKARAALESMSLSEYLLRELARVAERPSRSELLARIARRKPVQAGASAANMVREERDRR